MELTEAEVTAKGAVPETDPTLAEMVVLPAATACASPLVGVELLMVAVAVFEEVQVAELVRFCVLVSL